MDRNQFDRLARIVSQQVSRRGSLAAAASLLLGSGLAGRASGVAEATAGHRAPKRRPNAEGPCGNGSRKDNICSQDKDCCTGVCSIKAGKKNRDGKGRCRCIRKGGACKQTKNCCKAHACENGVCGGGSGPNPPDPIPTGQACTPSDTCADSAASCIPYGDNTPVGTYCLLVGGGACSANDDCDSHSCTANVCDALCVANVCASGCAYTDVEAAFAALPGGSTITIAPGTYSVGIDVDKSMTLEGCGDGVVLQYKTGANAVFYDNASAAITLTLKRLTLEEIGGGGNTMLAINGYMSVDASDCVLRDGYYGIYGDANDATTAKFTNCQFDFGDYPGYGFYVYSIDLELKNCTFADSYGNVIDKGQVTVDGCTFTGQLVYPYSQYDAAQSDGGTLTMTNTSFINTKSTAIDLSYTVATFDGVSVTGANTSRPGAGFSLIDGTYTLTNTTISGNTTTGVGGGMIVGAYGANITVTLGTGVTITGNTATNGSGIAMYRRNSNVATITGAPAATTGNTGGDQCVQGTSESGPWTAVSGCAY